MSMGHPLRVRPCSRGVLRGSGRGALDATDSFIVHRGGRDERGRIRTGAGLSICRRFSRGGSWLGRIYGRFGRRCSRAGHGGLSVGLSVGACRSVAVGISLRGGRPGVVIFRVVIGLVILLGAAAAAAVGHDTGTSGIVFVISLLVVRRGVRVGGFRVAALAAAAWCAAAGGWGAMPVPSAR